MNRVSKLASTFLIGFAALFALAGGARGAVLVGTALPVDFPVILDASLHTPLFGFGATGKVVHTPVVFVHGNNDTPFPTACNAFYGDMHKVAQYFADHGYALSELWGLGYQGDQCDLGGDQTIRSSQAHTAAANVDDLRRFVHAVLAYTGASEVDIVGHSLGVVIAREWLRQDPGASRLVRRMVGIDGANHGIINCSPSPLNYWQLPANGGFTPASAICVELGSPDTPFLQRLNRGNEAQLPPADVLVIRNGDTGFVYFPTQDGFLPGVPAIDSFGKPTDFSGSARLRAVRDIDLTGQGVFDPILGTTHLGILNSPRTWQATFEFLSEHSHAPVR